MFNAKQSKLLNTLGLTSDKERMETYEAYCEVDCEMRANGCPTGSFTDYLERKVIIAQFNAKRNAEKSLKQMA